MLLEKYHVTPYANDIKTGETALHIACKLKSPLRFLITCRCPDLIFAVDIAGEQPLHVACSNNDIEYVTWLFQIVIEQMERTVASTPTAFNTLQSSKEDRTSESLLKRLGSPSLSESFAHRKLPLENDEEDEKSSDKPIQLEIPASQELNHPSVSINSDHNATDNDSCVIIDNTRYQPVATVERRRVYSRSFNEGTSNPVPSDLTNSSTLTNGLSSGYESLLNTSELNFSAEYNTQTPSAVPPSSSQDNEHQTTSSDNLTCSISFWSSTEATTFIDSTTDLLRTTTSSYGQSPFDLKIVLSVHMRLFALNTSGITILHIIAKNGYHDLLQLILQVAKYLEHNPDGADIEVLTRRESSATPIDEAIYSNQSKCLRLLLDFAEDTSIFDDILNDCHLLTRAVRAETEACLNVLLGKGIWKGIKDALVFALKEKKSFSIIRTLVFYYTQILSATEHSRVKRGGVVTMDTGMLQWDSLEFEELAPCWFEDAVTAVSTVANTFKVRNYSYPIQDNKELFLTLGKACNDYFAKYVWQPQANPDTARVSLGITEINLSNNKLQSIPPELFQISTLVTLNLSKNRLYALPSNLDFQSPLYVSKKLVTLDLSCNQLQTLPEDLFFVMGNNLEELNAQHNQIESLPPALWVCTRLHTLLLGHNKLTQLHYLSNTKYFYDQDYSRSLISSFQVERGVPINSGKASEEEFMEIMNYVTRLNVFHHTVADLLPKSLEEQLNTQSPSLVQQVIDIHWLRSKLDEATTLDYFDVKLPHDEDLSLTHLDLSQNRFTNFPWDLPCLAPNLEKLDIRGNMIETVNILNDMPANIASIILAENKISTVTSTRPTYPCGNPINLLTGYVINPRIKGSCKHCTHCILDKVTNLILSDNQIVYFPCISSTNDESSKLLSSSLEKYKYQPYFPNVSVLSLDRNFLEAVPFGIQYLTQLSSLSLSYNIGITHLPPEMGLMNPQVLLVLKLDGVFPKNIDLKLFNKPGTRAILTYLKSLYHK